MWACKIVPESSSNTIQLWIIRILATRTHHLHWALLSKRHPLSLLKINSLVAAIWRAINFWPTPTAHQIITWKCLIKWREKMCRQHQGHQKRTVSIKPINPKSLNHSSRILRAQIRNCKAYSLQKANSSLQGTGRWKAQSLEEIKIIRSVRFTKT